MDDHGEAREAALVDAEIAQRQGVAVDHPGAGQALAGKLGHQPLVKQRLGALEALGGDHLDLDRGDGLPGRWTTPR